MLWNKANNREDNREEITKNRKWENREQLICVLWLIGRILFIDTICNP